MDKETEALWNLYNKKKEEPLMEITEYLEQNSNETPTHQTL